MVLLADYADMPDFSGHIQSISSIEFFAKSQGGLRRGYGRDGDNWIFDIDVAQDRLGGDIFSAFLPIFVRQLQSLIQSLVAPRLTTDFYTDGANAVFREASLTGGLRWGNAKIPQIECYFERSHSQSVSAVRSAATVALANLDDATIVRHWNPTSIWAERVGDSLSIGTTIVQGHRLLIYAKSNGRIRFEIKRLGKADYRGLSVALTPEQRLVDICNMERGRLPGICRWDVVGSFFTLPPRPALSDITRLCGLIAEACQDAPNEIRPVFERIFEDGGVARSGLDSISEAVVERLCAAGVLQRMSIRQRGRSRQFQRVALRHEYQSVIDAICLALARQDETA